jgi:hypothetical protein
MDAPTRPLWLSDPASAASSDSFSCRKGGIGPPFRLSSGFSSLETGIHMFVRDRLCLSMVSPATRMRFVVAIRRARETGFSRLRTDPDSCMNTGTMTRLRQRPKEPGVCKGKKMKRHCHEFVDNYQGLVGFGMDHETDGNTVRYYLQKFSDDQLMNHLIPRMSHEELEEIFVLINRILRNHLTEGEYHCLFLKDDHPHG